MPTNNTPESEPAADETPQSPQPQPQPQPQRQPEGSPDGSRDEVIKQYEQEKQAAAAAERAERLDHPESRYSRLRNAIRRPIYNVLLAGALVVNPVVTGGILATRMAADRTIGNIPVVKTPYNAATGVVDKIGGLALDTATYVAAAPAIIPDRVEDVHEVITNNVRSESKGFIGRSMEMATEATTKTLKATAEALTFTVKKTFEGIGWTVSTLTEPIRSVINGYAKALVTKPMTTILSTAVVAGGIASMGALPAATSVFDATLAILQGIAKWLGVPVPVPVP